MIIDWDATGKLATAVVALYGAALATINAVLQRRRDRRSLRLEAAVVPHVERGVTPDTQSLVIVAVNTGHRPIIVDRWGLGDRRGWHDLKDHSALAKLPPWVLADGEEFKAWVDTVELVEFLRSEGRRSTVKLRVWLRDTTGSKWATSAGKIDVGE